VRVSRVRGSRVRVSDGSSGQEAVRYAALSQGVVDVTPVTLRPDDFEQIQVIITGWGQTGAASGRLRVTRLGLGVRRCPVGR
jgi:hypothetical protein